MDEPERGLEPELHLEIILYAILASSRTIRGLGHELVKLTILRYGRVGGGAVVASAEATSWAVFITTGVSIPGPAYIPATASVGELVYQGKRLGWFAWRITPDFPDLPPGTRQGTVSPIPNDVARSVEVVISDVPLTANQIALRGLEAQRLRRARLRLVESSIQTQVALPGLPEEAAQLRAQIAAFDAEFEAARAARVGASQSPLAQLAQSVLGQEATAAQLSNRITITRTMSAWLTDAYVLEGQGLTIKVTRSWGGRAFVEYARRVGPGASISTIPVEEVAEMLRSVNISRLSFTPQIDSRASARVRLLTPTVNRINAALNQPPAQPRFIGPGVDRWESRLEALGRYPEDQLWEVSTGRVTPVRRPWFSWFRRSSTGQGVYAERGFFENLRYHFGMIRESVATANATPLIQPGVYQSAETAFLLRGARVTGRVVLRGGRFSLEVLGEIGLVLEPIALPLDALSVYEGAVISSQDAIGRTNALSAFVRRDAASPEIRQVHLAAYQAWRSMHVDEAEAIESFTRANIVQTSTAAVNARLELENHPTNNLRDLVFQVGAIAADRFLLAPLEQAGSLLGDVQFVFGLRLAGGGQQLRDGDIAFINIRNRLRLFDAQTLAAMSATWPIVPAAVPTAGGLGGQFRVNYLFKGQDRRDLEKTLQGITRLLDRDTIAETATPTTAISTRTLVFDAGRPQIDYQKRLAKRIGANLQFKLYLESTYKPAKFYVDFSGDGRVLGVSVVNTGSYQGVPDGSYPVSIVDDGPGSGATGRAIIISSEVFEVLVTWPGSGYEAPYVLLPGGE